MTVEELLYTPLMRGARLIAGKSGVIREVMWCASDTEAVEGNEIMPGLLLLATVHEEPRKLFKRYVDRLGKTMVAGLAYFAESGRGDFSDEEIEQAISQFDKLRIPVIKLPLGTNPVTFKRRFAAMYSRYYTEQQRRSDWLQELCQGGKYDDDEILAITHGYNPDMNYYAMIVEPQGAGDYDPLMLSLEMEAAKNHMKSRLSKRDARVLYYMGTHRVHLFFPWEGMEDVSRLRRLVVSAAKEMHESYPNLTWWVSVGSIADSMREFRPSHEHALMTHKLTWRLARPVRSDGKNGAFGLAGRVNLYDDWCMHMLLLKRPQDELREHVRLILGPIMDPPRFVDTLRSYLLYGENIRETSRRTGIPEGTIKYRLKRVEELLSSDLSSPQERFRLRMALVIMLYLDEPLGTEDGPFQRV